MYFVLLIYMYKCSVICIYINMCLSNCCNTGTMRKLSYNNTCYNVWLKASKLRNVFCIIDLYV